MHNKYFQPLELNKILEYLKNHSNSNFKVEQINERVFENSMEPNEVWELLNFLEEKGFVREIESKDANRYMITDSGDRYIRNGGFQEESNSNFSNSLVEKGYVIYISDVSTKYNIWNVNPEELRVIVDAYQFGKDSFFHQGEIYNLDNSIREFQIFEHTLENDKLEEFKQFLRDNKLFSGWFFEEYAPTEVLKKYFHQVTVEFINGEYGYLADPELDINNQDLFPVEIFDETRKYLKIVAQQANKCYRNGCYDAAQVMLRRLLESLIIECFERYGQDHVIKDPNGHFFLLRDLVDHFLKNLKWNISRNAKKSLGKIRDSGNLSAHNRKYNARKG